MTDILLALVPHYGLWLIIGAVALSCLALPVPATILVMAGGGFSAAGDLVLWQVITASMLGLVLGDQIAFFIARHAGSGLTARAKARPRLGPRVQRAEAMFEKRGAFGVFLSRTIFSPIGPYMSYLSGALGLGWSAFTTASVIGGTLWATGYAWTGFAFADQIVHLAGMMGNFFAVILAGTVMVLSGYWLVKAYRAERRKGS